MKQNYLFFDVEDIQPKITTIGFALSESQRNLILCELLKLEDRSPAESHLALTLIRSPEGYRASLVVNSFTRVFRTQTIRKDLENVISRVIEKMDLEIAQWKRNREIGGRPTILPDTPLAC